MNKDIHDAIDNGYRESIKIAKEAEEAVKAELDAVLLKYNIACKFTAEREAVYNSWLTKNT